MNGKTLVVAGLAVLVTAAGGGAALTGTGAQATPTSEADATTGPRHVDVATTMDDGTVTFTVTSNGEGVENVSVLVDDERVGTTDANGTVTFATGASEDLELTLVKGEFEGTLKYQVENGSLTLVEEEYEYAELDDDEDEQESDDDVDAEDADDAEETEDEEMDGTDEEQDDDADD